MTQKLLSTEMYPGLGSGIKYYSKLGEYIITEGLNFDYTKCISIERIKEILEVNISKVGYCLFNDQHNNPIKKKKNGFPVKRQKEVIDNPDFEGVLVKFDSLSNDLWKTTDTEGIYFITFNDFIVKIGMTETSFENRFKSYCCGSRKNMKKGSPSTTNFIICEVIYTALQLGINVEIYGINIPKEKREIEVYGRKTISPVSVVRAHEEIITNIYKENNGSIPPLCVQHASNTC